MSCDRLWLHIPWSALHSRPVQIKIGSLRLQLRLHPEGPYAEAEALRKVLAQGNSVPKRPSEQSLRLSDVRLAVLDGLRITLESLHVLCADAAAGLLASKTLPSLSFRLYRFISIHLILFISVTLSLLYILSS